MAPPTVQLLGPCSSHRNWAWLGSARVVETMATTPELAVATEAMRTALVPAVTAAVILAVVA